MFRLRSRLSNKGAQTQICGVVNIYASAGILRVLPHVIKSASCLLISQMKWLMGMTLVGFWQPSPVSVTGLLRGQGDFDFLLCCQLCLCFHLAVQASSPPQAHNFNYKMTIIGCVLSAVISYRLKCGIFQLKLQLLIFFASDWICTLATVSVPGFFFPLFVFKNIKGVISFLLK